MQHQNNSIHSQRLIFYLLIIFKGWKKHNYLIFDSPVINFEAQNNVWCKAFCLAFSPSPRLLWAIDLVIVKHTCTCLECKYCFILRCNFSWSTPLKGCHFVFIRIAVSSTWTTRTVKTWIFLWQNKLNDCSLINNCTKRVQTAVTVQSFAIFTTSADFKIINKKGQPLFKFCWVFPYV